MQIRLVSTSKKRFLPLLLLADIVTRVTAWGVTDSDSWKNDFPIRGRRDYPLLFDRNYQPKEFIQKMMDEQSDTTAIAQK